MKKLILGQFFTKKNTWLTKPVINFIEKNTKKCKSIVDPFAGIGDLFTTIRILFSDKQDFKYLGYDIDDKLGWTQNDSLLKIPKISKSFFVTNPPYLSKNSCKRNDFSDSYKKYFLKFKFTDLYMIALHQMIETGLPGIAIVPETIIKSTFPKDKINRIVIIEPNPFEDTEVPICVVCFNGSVKEKIKIYKNDKYIGKLENLNKLLPKPDSLFLYDLRFNDIRGKIAIKGVDSTDPLNKIKFLNKEDLLYSISKIKNTSRAITIVGCEIFKKCNQNQINKIIKEANTILHNFRAATNDVLLAPFKGNNKKAERRRRLDFHTARNILEIAYSNVISR
ncbi:hypothetical protein SHELI_v1c00370 [Spiroplasma helicoides]|uniref:Uncharacterized protein n=1 Tax=Spiroplasma helicoides TaxID=216938 RepID=A0A1B3SJ86_9MOLU|nr:hypothetical protein [Spiroplasma helicoides]AOG59992.1 hypothetical protein SHELI_v1c00370 [Spiroplasma helicoides]